MAGKDKIENTINKEVSETLDEVVEFLNDYLDEEHANVASFTAIKDWNVAIGSLAQLVKEGYTETGIPGRVNVLKKIMLQCSVMFSLLMAVDTDGSDRAKALAKAVLKKAKMVNPAEQQPDEMEELKKLIG